MKTPQRKPHKVMSDKELEAKILSKIGSTSIKEDIKQKMQQLNNQTKK